jgi:transcriptional regulator with XRE-family HTH domain
VLDSLKILDLRKQNGWTQEELAELLGVHQSQVSRWESGKTPVPDHIVKLIECLEK